jgi:hypothetical protein
MTDDLELEAEQQQVLRAVVEARRSVSREDRQRFSYMHVSTYNRKAYGILAHPGLPGGRIKVNPLDMDALFDSGAFRVAEKMGDTTYLDVTKDGLEYYESLMVGEGSPVQRVEGRMWKSLLSGDFQTRHRGAYDKWANAEQLLWGDDSPEQLSRIGLLCRESVILFVDALVEKYQPSGVNPDKSRTKDRLNAVIGTAKPDMGKKEGEWLKSLLDYLLGSNV